MNEFYFNDVNYNLHVNEEYSEEHPYIEGSATITLQDEESNNIDIGSLSFSIFNTNILDNSFLIQDIADSVSGDLLHLIGSFCKFIHVSKDSYYENVLCLNYIKIHKGYRNSSYGSYAINDLIKLCKVINVDYIILQPAPIEGKLEGTERKDIINQLTKYYSKFGFQIFNPNIGEHIMIFDLEWNE
jgi:hypothetical protein